MNYKGRIKFRGNIQMMPQLNTNQYNYFTLNTKEVPEEQYLRQNDIESWLSNYNMVKSIINNLEIDLADIDGGIRSADTTTEGGRSSKISRISEDTLLRKELIESKINFVNNKYKKVTNAINNLSHDEYIVIRKFYMDNLVIRQIADELNYSISTVNRIKRRAVDKIIMAVYVI